MNKKIEKLQIITPFLNGEKSLKTIEKESEISYATLKRWIKSYKEKGEEGLNTKKRADKNSFRKANDIVIEKIENIYLKNKEKPLLEIYQKVKENMENNLSFNTFYRILSNLDSYLKNKYKFQLNKNIKNGEIYIIQSFISYHFISDGKTSKLPIILLAFNAATLDFVDFHICFSNKFDNNLLSFFRKLILKGAELYNAQEFPKEILLDSKFSIPKKIKENIQKITKIKILELESENDEILKFISLLKTDLSNTFKEETSYKEFFDFLINYSTYYNPKSKLIMDSEKINSLNCFLTSTKRKIHIYGIQINNNFYNENFLKNYIGKTVDILYDPLDINKIFILFNNEYIPINKV